MVISYIFVGNNHGEGGAGWDIFSQGRKYAENTAYWLTAYILWYKLVFHGIENKACLPAGNGSA
jgi:hypothetical protein